MDSESSRSVTASVDAAIVGYFNDKLTHKAILKRLWEDHQVVLGLSSLKRNLRRLNLNRYSVKLCERERNVEKVVRHVQRDTGGQAGYRRTLKILQEKYDVKATPREIRHALAEVAPENITKRTKSSQNCLGPNCIWDVTSYDRLSSYGFSISGCVDRFSSMIIWLKCSTPAYRYPDVIMKYYLDAIEEIGGCPSFLKSDLEIENGMMSAVHCSLREQPEDGCHVRDNFQDEHVNNLIKTWEDHWIETFEELTCSGAFTSKDSKQISVLTFAFAELMTRDLWSKRDEWNSLHVFHKWRSSLGSLSVPNELYYSPPLGFPEQKKHFSSELLQELTNFTIIELPIDKVKNTIHDRCLAILKSLGKSLPDTKEEARKLYLYMCTVI